MRRLVLSAILVVLIGGAWLLLPTSGTDGLQAGQIEKPTFYDAEIAKQYSTLGSEGYAALDKGDLEEAVAKFTEQAELIPQGNWGYYNLACAYSRNEQVDEAFTWLTKAVNNGWDNPSHLESDGDLEPLRQDARFEKLVQKARATAEERDAMLAAGLPEYSTAPVTFEDEESLNKWYDEQKDLISLNSRVWHDWQTTAAKMDLEAKKLAVLRELKKDDPDFDYALQRISVMSQLKSYWDDHWGPLSSTIIKEVDAYLNDHSSDPGVSEVAYRGGVAVMMRDGLRDASTDQIRKAATEAKAYFSKVDQSSDFIGATQGWQIAAKLALIENPQPLYPEVRSFAEKYVDSDGARRIASIFFPGAVVQSMWPLPIEATDIDGKPVSLDQYDGKVLLVDFWATWCPPCRGELPYIKAAYDKYHDDGFEILSISLDYPDRLSQEEYRSWIEENGMVWRHVYDEQNWDGPIVKRYFVMSIPSPFLIGRDGSLVALHDDCSGEDLGKSIEKALAPRPHSDL
jgi:thiol-disulfide isomerase/thioredoxin/tetratricopeptide (TPR) repeat protein